MSVATTAWIWIISIALVLGLLAAHLRFTLRNATLSALPLLCGGLLGTLLAMMLEPAGLSTFASGSLRGGLAPLLIGVAGAASVRIRHLFAGIPAALAIPPGPSNIELLAAIDAQGKAMSQWLQRFAAEQQQQNHATLTAALHDVIDDFHQRINGQFRQHLSVLQAFVADTGALLEKHRTQQMETMHHERRSADQIQRSVQEFHALLAQSEGLATLAGQVRQALELLGPRQEALAADLVQMTQDLGHTKDSVAALHAQFDGALDEFVLRSRRDLDGVGKRVGQSSSELQQAMQRAAEQTRTHISDIAGKQQQQMAAMNRELSEALGKPLAAMSKQLTGVQSKLSSELAPMAQQIRRAADLSKR
jgi:hypothetical protein